MKLTFVREDNGFCRVYYTTADRRLYCWQDDTGRGGFVFYRCSRDGEPSHDVSPPDHTPRPPGETTVGRDLIAFLSASERRNGG